MTEHPCIVISIYQVCRIAGQAYVKSFSMENITSALRATGLCPLNSEIFLEQALLSAAVTDIPLDSDENDTQQSPRSSNDSN